MVGFVIFIASSASGQVVTGTVTEAGSGEPIPGVNVYLSGTTIGQATDRDGNYTITPSTAGRYDLVFSFVGYKKEIRRIDLTSSSSITIDVKMEQDVQQLEEVEVVSSNKKWKEQYEFFFDQFIGQTPFARQTTIDNRWILDFTERDNNLIAEAQKPIIVTNRALGYKIYIELVEFDWPKYRNQGGVYKIYQKYERLMPQSEQQLHHWKKNRIEAYLGSFHHFLKSLYEDKLNENDFSLDESYNIKPLSRGETNYQLLSRGTTADMRDNYKGFQLNQRLDVQFERLVRYQFNDDTYRLSIEKDAAVAPNFQSRTFFVDKNGALLDPISLVVFGSWGRARVANGLPSDYTFN